MQVNNNKCHSRLPCCHSRESGNPCKGARGQTALILILLAAAALIFLAITLNWGRIAQIKALVTIAADESASLMASDAASYGEMQKQTYLNDTNQIVENTGVLLALILVIVAIIITIASWGSATPFIAALLIAAVVMATVNLVLQVVVIQPGITRMWNSLQKNQPVQQQFYEGGITAALQGSVTDQVNITDYADWNANGKFGVNSSGFPNDTVSRFAVFYTDRLKMLNQPPIPQVVFFYDALGELMNGETCDENANDVSLFGASPNPACAGLNCANNPLDPACQLKIPNGFQLNDACTGSNPGNPATYSPYCDPCCQPQYVPGSNPPKALRPSSCLSGDSNCSINNPYGPSHPDIYDPAFQNYAAKISFLDQFGRDQQMGPFTANLTPQGSASNGIFFPNGIYPFFWLMDEYSPQVDNIDPTGTLQSAQVHWCAPATTAANGVNIPTFTNTTGYSDLNQLNLINGSGYACQGKDCCVNFLADKVGSIGGISTPVSDGSTKGTTNGAIDLVGANNLALDPSFGEGGGGAGSWLPGDNQMCLTTWPYNGSSATGMADGTCEWTDSAAVPPPTAAPSPTGAMTVDGVDDAVHTLSGFVNFANTLLSNDVGTLSATFTTWYPQAANWISPTTGRLPPVVANLNTWHGVITNWLKAPYTPASSPYPWCVPPQSDPSLNVNGSPTTENTYITANGGSGQWGDLPHVIACLNYNTSTSVGNYQSCQTLLQNNCPASLSGTACDPSILGRSLAGTAPFFDGCNGNYAKWVSDSLTLATDEAPKFTLRSLYLQDVSTRANTMENIFGQGYTALQNFLSGAAAQLNSLTCGDGSTCVSSGLGGGFTNGRCSDGKQCIVSPTTTLPNSVIYGWVDNTRPNGLPGYAHIVKITAYSVSRMGGSNLPLPQPPPQTTGNSSILPWIETVTKTWLGIPIWRSYTLVDRDGWVYASVKRWDEDHSNSILFPNGHPLWQFMFHNPSGSTTTGQGLMQACNGVTLPGGTPIGFGLEPQTVAGLGFTNISPKDQTALANAFMLNDRGDGKVDPYAKNSNAYSSCLQQANALLANAPESHVCAQYIASRNASGGSGNGDSDYSLKFVSCDQQLEDL